MESTINWERVFKISNFEPGRDIEEAIVPSRMGYTKETLLS